MPGGGITARNVGRIVAEASPQEIHFAALEIMASTMKFRRPYVYMGGELRPPEYDRAETSAACLRAIMTKASS
jgi:copper homeostasis protein